MYFYYYSSDNLRGETFLFSKLAFDINSWKLHAQLAVTHTVSSFISHVDISFAFKDQAYALTFSINECTFAFTSAKYELSRMPAFARGAAI